MKADATNGPGVPGIPAHKPYVPEETVLPELGVAPVVVGALLGIIFGASSLYLVLQVGMTVSASIPIAVLSITLFRVFTPLFGRNATILENNIVQTTGSAGESIAFGVGVTMPALLILGYNLELTRVMLVAVLGGLLGVLMMIPLRRMFIVKQHGKLAYPEGLACADVLIVGEKGGASAKTVFAGFGLAFVYQFLMKALKLWLDEPHRLLKFGKLEFKGAEVALESSPALLGVGYVIGPRISCIMVGGGILASWVLIPAIMLFGSGLTAPLFPAEKLISAMSLEEIWHDYVLYIGAGAVAAGGIISMCQSLPTIVGSIRAGFRDLAARNRGGSTVVARSGSRFDRDLSMRVVIFGCLGLVLAISVAPMLNMNPLGAILIVAFGFLFVTVSARLTGEIGSSSNPISGMTVATLLLTCLIFVAIGWTGEFYRLTALSIAGIVCIASSNGGTVAQCLKTGFIVGATPRHQQIAILVGALTSALVIGVTLLMLNDGATVYSRQELPQVTVDVSQLSAKEPVGGRYAGEDQNEYLVLHARAGQIGGVPAGKYLVDETGTIRYLVDPGINGRLKKHDDGTEVDKFTAPKAALMSFIVDGILTQKLPWSLVLLGVSISIVLELAGIPSLPFAVGVYLPLSASTPIFCGGMMRYLADRWSRRSAAEAEMSSGVLLSAGYIAGGTIAGIIVNFMSTNKELGEALAVGKRWFPELCGSPGFAAVPFSALMVVLLLVGADKLLRTRA
ncbi:MAG: oligopeptide transporter, OPT family [Planctomycetes bacterium]|nr:oligopeptide transporter, OPT family [Planctomycetota bacterium]